VALSGSTGLLGTVLLAPALLSPHCFSSPALPSTPKRKECSERRQLLLAAIGLYGVTSYTVVRRTPEIGIRMALGAARSRVIGMVMRGAMLQTLIGLAIGISVAIFCVRYVKSQLYEITRVNVPAMIIAIGVLVLAAAIAGIIPARRAASIDPVQALRIE
jgi:macrolide transport system ATP-binding/permease protein